MLSGLCCIPLHEYKQTDQKAILDGGEGGGLRGQAEKAPLKKNYLGKEEVGGWGVRRQKGKQTELKDQNDSTDNEAII